MTPITMMNADNSRKILLNHNYQRHLRSILIVIQQFIWVYRLMRVM
ncbi:hypothetical protein Mettu_1588 [Methylobacter tundripaludum SV96]|uniref:Uncharacterized protein n=1 Tax=Methylobacter tundripaludum (strain ATCC BAA-1195 / DSM 17260 / SV96) TaxID=697282 RepID=G3IUP1_METTV|nr:hypothetical protein Mettu_1588 [Methylobacter tundripaludum SV96]